MSLAEEMLATMPLSYDSATYSADEEPHIVINESRQAIVPNELKTLAVTGDHKVEKITFDCVRFWDGNDLSTFAIYLNYVLPDLSTGTYIPSSIVADDNVFHFDWDIKNNITKKSGKIAFAITAIKTKRNDYGETVVDKQWSSIPNGDCSIVLGIDISNVPSEEESSDVLAQMSDILEQMQPEINAIKSELSEFVYVLTQNKLEQGTWENGAKAETIKFLRCQEKIYAPVGSVIEIIPNGLYYTISQYTSLSDTTPTTMGYLGGEKITIATAKPYFTIAVSNGANYSASTQIAISDYVGSVVCYKILSINDINLRINNQAGTFANALKGTKSDTAILIDDVSPVTHDMGVKVRGKNLFDVNTTPTFNNTGATYVVEGTKVTFKSNNSVNSVFSYSIPTTVGKTYTVSVNSIDWDSSSFGMFLSSVMSYDTMDYGVIDKIILTKTFVAVSDTLWIHGYLSYERGDYTFTFDKLQVELGTTATYYTPYVPNLTAVTVSRCGKNLLDINKARSLGGLNSYDTFSINDNVITATSDNSTTKIAIMALFDGELPAGDYILSLNAVIKNTPKHNRPSEILIFKNGSFLALNNSMGKDGSYSPKIKFTLSEKAKIRIDFYKSINVSQETVSDTVYKVTLSNIQLELGSTATDYEPYKECAEYTPNADGTVNGVTSLYPNTTLTTDTDGVLIDCEYNRDINKAFAELQQAIISLGGNV